MKRKFSGRHPLIRFASIVESNTTYPNNLKCVKESCSLFFSTGLVVHHSEPALKYLPDPWETKHSISFPGSNKSRRNYQEND